MARSDQNYTIQALQAIERGDWDRAENLVARARDPLASKIFYWLYYTERGGPISFERIRGFIRQNPDWPGQGRLKFVAEQVMPDDYPDEKVISWFHDYEPLTMDGAARFFLALKRQGHHQALQKALQTWWREALIKPQQQAFILRRYGSALDRESHIRRLDKLLFHRHYTNGRKIARLLGKGYPALAEARIALAEDKHGVDRLVAAVPPHLKNDPGLVYERVRWRRRHGKTYGAIELLHEAPVDAGLVLNKSDWWRERHILARRLIENGQYDHAYDLVSAHKQEEGFSFAQAEFLGGWLALRFTGKPARAFEHFEALFYSVSTPISRARGAYWAGEASAALGRADIARQWYDIAARYHMTYYGQLASSALGNNGMIPGMQPPTIDAQSKQRFDSREKVQAAKIFSQAGMRREASAFIGALAEELDRPGDYLMLAALSERLEHFHDALRIAKQGVGKNIYLPDHAYPSILPVMHDIETEWALVHALIRQESAFDYQAVSPAGARGLMQLMPATAREVSRRNGISHRTSWLTGNPKHNVRLGSAYLEQMLARYDGSYPLALAAYNGGPGRVDRWLAQYGDPRTGQIGMIDWIELIPVYETRNYVQRVLENTYVYRQKFKNIQEGAEAPIHVAMRGMQSNSYR